MLIEEKKKPFAPVVMALQSKQEVVIMKHVLKFMDDDKLEQAMSGRGYDDEYLASAKRIIADAQEQIHKICYKGGYL